MGAFENLQCAGPLDTLLAGAQSRRAGEQIGTDLPEGDRPAQGDMSDIDHSEKAWDLKQLPVQMLETFTRFYSTGSWELHSCHSNQFNCQWRGASAPCRRRAEVHAPTYNPQN